VGKETVRREGKTVGLEFKPKLSAILAVVHGTSIALAYIVTRGKITAMILWFAVSTGVMAGLSYYTDHEKTENQTQRSTPKPER
jgi:hypothetical protein